MNHKLHDILHYILYQATNNNILRNVTPNTDIL